MRLGRRYRSSSPIDGISHTFAVADDCNDDDEQVNPDAEEVCDDVDNDCDGDIDEGLLQSYYLDSDGDGFGDDNIVIEDCELLSSYSLFGGDCDDIDPEINELENVYVYNIDHLQSIAQDYLEQRQNELTKCETYIRSKAQEWLEAWKTPPKRGEGTDSYFHAGPSGAS